MRLVLSTTVSVVQHVTQYDTRLYTVWKRHRCTVACIAAYHLHCSCHPSPPSPLLSPAILLKVPIPVVQRTHLSRLQPPTDTMKVKGVIARTPRYRTVVHIGAAVVRLTLDAEVHYMVAADGAAVDDEVPRPEADCVPPLHLEQLGGLDELFFATTAAGG